ncbi:PLP-dependent aminotransferase family protein [Mycetocola tolaasinivorans]|uniref:PLP-dependent aminotransferase family protein n=1 Tax=Mycetocola tolaasinivorans TaxID=76635 RepID=A0A3L7A630_9MICO|nr:PLP-dependent aminotransferase family protein [Mycetocola tolaasinivorans]RLP75280.1 PLP-dependent aminotransferase family protein [Mycetocola tolaasinivorans]
MYGDSGPGPFDGRAGTIRNARQLHNHVAELIGSGELAVGDRLPTIREVATVLELSPSTVAAAWALLRESDLVETKRRGGTTIADTRKGKTRTVQWSEIDLSWGYPQYDLHPALGRILVDALREESLNVVGREYILPRLQRQLEPGWPFVPPAWTTAGGGTEAMYLALNAIAREGGPIGVEVPAAPGALDMLRELDVAAVTIHADEQGPLVDSVRAALAQGVSGIVLQPTGSYARFGRLSRQRMGELAAVLREAPAVWIVEDDTIGPLGPTARVSLGEELADRVLHVRCFCKAYGVDIRTAVLAGSAELVERVNQARSNGYASNSRILQNALAGLIRDQGAAHSVSLATAAYARHRTLLLEELRDAGLTARAGADSLVVWVDIPDEAVALINLARSGIDVGSGRTSYPGDERHTPCLRIAVTQLPDDRRLIRELVDHISHAAVPELRELAH